MSTRGRKKDQAKFHELISTFIVSRNLPINCVEWKEFRNLCSYLNFEAKPISRNIADVDILKMYKKQKEVIRNKLASIPGKICFTSNLWTSVTTDSYICLTAHWVDEEWVLQKQLLNFSHMPLPHSGQAIANKIFSMLSDWGIEDKIFSITFDNALSNDKCVEIMINRLLLKKTLYCYGAYFHVRCCAHILNLVVKDGLKTMDPAVEKIRAVVKFLKSSQEGKAKFLEIVEVLGIKERMVLRQDVPTRWNSTYLMLQSCIAYREVFEHLKVADDHFKDCPTTGEWEQIGVIFQFLKAFYNVTNVFSRSKYPTSNLYFGRICHIQELLLKGRNNGNEVIKNMVTQMQTKFDKYWSDLSPVLAMATVFDPRLKLSFVEYTYKHFYDEYYVHHLVDDVRDRMDKLYFEYATSAILKERELQANAKEQVGTSRSGVGTSGESLDPYLQIYAQAQRRVGSVQSDLTELQQYLKEPAVSIYKEIDILTWWKGEEQRFPVLSEMVRDILTIPISTVASESAFSIGGRILDEYRSSLNPETAEALVTTRDWIYGISVDDLEVKLDELVEDVLEIEVQTVDEPSLSSIASNSSNAI